MKQLFALIASVCFFIQCFTLNKKTGNVFLTTIENPDKKKNISIPIICEGWCIRRGKVIENTTNDTIKIWDKFFAPGKTGTFLSMECYDCYKKAAWTTTYVPYKATKGKIVIEWSLKPD